MSKRIRRIYGIVDCTINHFAEDYVLAVKPLAFVAGNKKLYIRRENKIAARQEKKKNIHTHTHTHTHTHKHAHTTNLTTISVGTVVGLTANLGI